MWDPLWYTMLAQAELWATGMHGIPAHDRHWKKENLRATVVDFHLILGDIHLNNNSGTDSLYYQNTSSKKEYIPCNIHPRLHH